MGSEIFTTFCEEQVEEAQFARQIKAYRMASTASPVFDNHDELNASANRGLTPFAEMAEFQFARSS